LYQRLRGDASESLQRTAEGVRLNVVREPRAAVDLDGGDQLAVAGLELGDAADVDSLELEPELRPERLDLRQRPLAEMAPLRVVDDDPRGYG
jgi:hypothetical protein